MVDYSVWERRLFGEDGEGEEGEKFFPFHYPFVDFQAAYSSTKEDRRHAQKWCSEKPHKAL